MRATFLIKSKSWALFILLFLAPLMGCAQGDGEGGVTVTIGPLYGITAALLEGVAEPALMERQGDIHHLTLKPSDARHLVSSDLVVWLGPDLEPGLARTLASHDTPGFIISELHGIDLLPFRSHEGEGDPHIWLSVARMRLVAQALAPRLAEIYPEYQPQIMENAERLDRNLAVLSQDLSARMSALPPRPYVVLHDAYQYFEADYGLAPLAVLKAHEHLPPSARHLLDVEQRIKTSEPACLLVEASPPGELAVRIAAEFNLPIVVADPLGRDLVKGPDFYQQSMEAVVSSFEACLRP